MTGEPLPRSRPLWSATFVPCLADGGTGLVIEYRPGLLDGFLAKTGLDLGNFHN